MTALALDPGTLLRIVAALFGTMGLLCGLYLRHLGRVDGDGAAWMVGTTVVALSTLALSWVALGLWLLN